MCELRPIKIRLTKIGLSIIAACLFFSPPPWCSSRLAAQNKSNPQSLPTLSGVVLNSRDLSRVAGATVVVQSGDVKKIPILGATSGVDGSFIIRDVPAGKYFVRVEKANFKSRFCGQSEFSDETPIAVGAGSAFNLECRLTP